MGLSISKFFNSLFRKKETKILMLGLDAAGKTEIIFKLKLGEVVTTVPTIGFYVQIVQFKSIKFTVFGVGGETKFRPLYQHYFQDTQGLIFVVDSSDKERIDLAREELHKILEDEELRDTVLLVFANKQDKEGVMSVDEVAEKLKLNTLRERDWHIQGTCAWTGDGLYDGLDWLSKALGKKK